MSILIARNRVRAWLKSKWQVTVPDDWLTACIEWIYSEHEGLPPEFFDLQQMVYEQWLVSDLRELGTAILPEGLAEQDKVNLTGRYCLQVDSLVDVSVPYFGQLTKIRGKENENVNVSAATQQSQPSWEAKPTRMLMMSMTDGVQEVKGMEYKLIPSINPKLAPGTKVLVRGGVLCRNGVLMLTPENLSVLGGEVESMVEDNTPELNLQKALDQNIAVKDQPKTERRDYQTETRRKPQSNPSQSILRQKTEQTQASQWPSQQQQRTLHTHRANDCPPMSDEWGDEDMDFISGISDAELVPERQWECDDDRDLEAMMEDIDDDVLASQELYQMEQERLQRPEVQAVPSQPRSNPPTTTSTGPHHQPATTVPRPATRVSPWVTSNNTSVKQELSAGKMEVPNSWGQNRVQPSASAPVGSKCESLFHTERKRPRVDLDSSPFTYLYKVRESWPPLKITIVTVKAYVSTLLDKLDHNQGSHWSLRAKINDGSAAIDVKLSDQILTSLIGFSACECLRLRDAARHDKQARHRLTSGIKSCQENLINMSAFLEIKLDPSESSPVVLQHRKATMEDCVALTERNK